MNAKKRIKEDFDINEFSPEEQEIINSEDDMPDDFFDVTYLDEDDIWDDDTYIGDDEDIHQTDLANSPDDEEFDEFDYGFNDDDTIDVEDPEYWEDSKEIDPNDYDLINNLDAPHNWSNLTSEEDLNDDAFTSDEHLEDYKHAIRKAIDPAHSEKFRKIMSLDGMEESKKVTKVKRLKEDTAFFCSNKPKDENREIPSWVVERFGKIYESCNSKK